VGLEVATITPIATTATTVSAALSDVHQGTSARTRPADDTVISEGVLASRRGSRDRSAMAAFRAFAASMAAVILITGCGTSHVDTAYTVTSVQNDTTCLTLPAGKPAKGQPDHICATWPPTRIKATRPIRAGDCVVLRLHPESSGASELILGDPANCRP